MHGRPRPGATTSRSAGGGAPGAGRSSVGAGRSSSSREAAEALHALAASGLGGTPPAPPVGAWVQGTRSGRAPGADGGRGAAVSGGRSGGTTRPPGALSERYVSFSRRTVGAAPPYSAAPSAAPPPQHTARSSAQPSPRHRQGSRTSPLGERWHILDGRLREGCADVCESLRVPTNVYQRNPDPSPATTFARN